MGEALEANQPGSVWRLLENEVGTIGEPQPVAGGCINHSAILTLAASGRQVFAKTNRADNLPMFEAEAYSLEKLAEPRALLVPEPIRCGVVGDFAYLLVDYLPLGRGTPRQHHVLGEKLAELHRHESEDGRFGWEHDNFIGSTPQPNDWCDRWADFFAARI